jgi:hypothetical protein
MRLSKVILSVIVMAGLLSQVSAQAKETPTSAYRTIRYVYNQFVWTIWVTVTETATAAKGEVLAARVSPPAAAGIGHRFFNISKPEFEQMWSTLNVPGVEKRLVSGTQYDLNNEYVFQNGKRTWAVKKTSSLPAVSALASRLRNHAEAALKRPR